MGKISLAKIQTHSKQRRIQAGQSEKSSKRGMLPAKQKHPSKEKERQSK